MKGGDKQHLWNSIGTTNIQSSDKYKQASDNYISKLHSLMHVQGLEFKGSDDKN